MLYLQYGLSAIIFMFGLSTARGVWLARFTYDALLSRYCWGRRWGCDITFHSDHLGPIYEHTTRGRVVATCRTVAQIPFKGIVDTVHWAQWNPFLCGVGAILAYCATPFVVYFAAKILIMMAASAVAIAAL